MLSEEPVRLSDLRATLRCPNCSHLIQNRRATQQGDLWVVAEVCDDCGWHLSLENVKIGA